MPNKNENEDIASSLHRALNYHGHSFQYAVIKKVNDLVSERRSNWRFYGAEIPLIVHGQIIHADFILQWGNQNIFLVGECKRADPAKANWAFVKAPYVTTQTRTDAIFDVVRRPVNNPAPIEYGCSAISTNDFPYYQIGYEIKTGDKGDGSGISGKSAINDAVTQALRSSSGFINFLFDENHYQNIVENNSYIFIPAVFTTARIFASDANISESSLRDGKLTSETVDLEASGWLWFNTNRSNHLKHSLQSASPIGDIYQNLGKEFIRSVAIVNDEGIDEFFAFDFYEWVRFYLP